MYCVSNQDYDPNDDFVTNISGFKNLKKCNTTKIRLDFWAQMYKEFNSG